MRKARLVVIAFVAGVVTLGVPGHVAAAPSVPIAVDGVVRVAGSVAPGTHARRVLTLPWRANLAGLSYVSADDSGEGVEVTLRAFSGGAWSEPQHIEVEPDESADPKEAGTASRRVFTAPTWLDAADAVDVRVEVGHDAARIGDVRLHLTNTNGDAYAPTSLSRIASFFGAVGRFLSARAVDQADAATTKPTVISRKGWGADESLRGSGPGSAASAKVVFVHHTVNENSYSRSQAPALVRGIYRYHTLSRGYSDIGYNFLVDRYGRVFEGWAGGLDEPVSGAHTSCFNTGSIGVAMLGTFSSASPTSSMLHAMKRLVAWKMDIHHIPPVGKVTMVSAGSSKYEAGTAVTFNRIAAHRNANDTACPGWVGYNKIPWLRGAVDAIGHPKIYLPTMTSALLRPDGNDKHETVTFTARLSRTATWTLNFTDPAGRLLRSFTRTTSSVNVTWDGRRADGSYVPTSRARVTLTAKDAAGRSAHPATGMLYVVTTYPSGTLISDAGGPFVAGGLLRPLSSVARTSRFGSLAHVAAGPGLRSRMTAGPQMPIRDGALLAGPDGQRYIVSGGLLRAFAYDPTQDPPVDTFSALGYQLAAAIVADQATIDGLPPGPPVADITLHPDGTVVRDDTTGSMWVIAAGTRRPISALSRLTWYRTAEIVPMLGAEAELPLGAEFVPRSGALFAATDGGAPWVLGGSGTKRRFRDATLFSSMGYTSSMLLKATATQLDALPTASVFG